MRKSLEALLVAGLILATSGCGGPSEADRAACAVASEAMETYALADIYGYLDVDLMEEVVRDLTRARNNADNPEVREALEAAILSTTPAEFGLAKSDVHQACEKVTA